MFHSLDMSTRLIPKSKITLTCLYLYFVFINISYVTSYPQHKTNTTVDKCWIFYSILFIFAKLYFFRFFNAGFVCKGQLGKVFCENAVLLGLCNQKNIGNLLFFLSTIHLILDTGRFPPYKNINYIKDVTCSHTY